MNLQQKKITIKCGYYLILLKVFLQLVDPFCSLRGLIFTDNLENTFFVHFSDEPLEFYDWVRGIEHILFIDNPTITIMACGLTYPTRHAHKNTKLTIHGTHKFSLEKPL